MKTPNKNNLYIKRVPQNRDKTKLFRKFYFILGVLIAFMLLFILRFNEFASEFWVRNFYHNLQRVFSPLISIIPFSLTEIFFLALIITAITLIIKIIKNLAKKQNTISLNQALNLLIIATTVLTYYFATAGIAYSRYEVEIPLYQEKVEKELFTEVIQYFIDDFNLCSDNLSFTEEGAVKNPYTIKELNDILKEEYSKLESRYFSSYTPSVKPLLSSFLYREFNIAGIAFAPFFEPNVNYLIPNSQLVSTMAHEIAHNKGVMRKQDANLVSAYILLNSDNYYLKYSGYFTTIYTILNLAHYIGDDQAYRNLYLSLDDKIKGDITYVSNYWKQYTLLDDLAKWFNNMYLKLIGNEGVSSYIDKPTIGEEVDPDTGDIVKVIETFSPIQKLYFYFYFN